MPELPDVSTHNFADAEAQAVTLAKRLAERLRTGLGARGHALLAVSGGSTPKALFAHLAREALDWAHVRITLVDERCRSQASATCCGVAFRRVATLARVSDWSGVKPPSGKNEANAMLWSAV